MLQHLLKMSKAQLEVNLPFDITKRERALDILEKGAGSHYVAAALQRFARLVDDMEASLARSSWLVGETYSLADADFAPYLQRMEDIGLGFLWDDKPALRRWMGQVRARPSHAEIVDNWFGPEDRAWTLQNASRTSEEFAAILEAACSGPSEGT